MNRTLKMAVLSFLARLTVPAGIEQHVQAARQDTGLPAVTVTFTTPTGEPTVLSVQATNPFAEGDLIWRADTGDVLLAEIRLTGSTLDVNTDEGSVHALQAHLTHVGAGVTLQDRRARLVDAVAQEFQAFCETHLGQPCPVEIRYDSAPGLSSGLFGVSGLIVPFFTKERENGTLALYRAGDNPEQIAEARRGEPALLYDWAKQHMLVEVRRLGAA